MVDFNKEDWIINNRNVFELPKTEYVPISTIQYEILKQAEGKNITSVSDFLNAEIDTQKTITLTKGLNIDTIFSNHLKLNINPLNTQKTPVYLIFEWLTLYLFKRLADNDHFFITDVYKEKYQIVKNDWLNQNIDTDETDFINNELIKCEAIVLELQKPIYSQLMFSEVQPKPTEFKKNLNNIIDKRIKFLNETLNFLEAETVKPDEVYKTQLLFKVGLLFAKGEMNKYFTVNSKGERVMNNGFSAPRIAKELGNDSYNKYILASINNYTDGENGNKNIFNSLNMMKRIITHCEAENIAVDTYFRSRLPTE